jgi:uroporphyrinogen III methyltransferase/synthase
MVRRNKGKVYLVGAGPGDPGLLTLRGKECLEQADVVLYDYLANPILLAHAQHRAERVYVGRRGKGKYPEQEAINRLLIERAKCRQRGRAVEGWRSICFWARRRRSGSARVGRN